MCYSFTECDHFKGIQFQNFVLIVNKYVPHQVASLGCRTQL